MNTVGAVFQFAASLFFIAAGWFSAGAAWSFSFWLAWGLGAFFQAFSILAFVTYARESGFAEGRLPSCHEREGD